MDAFIQKNRLLILSLLFSLIVSIFVEHRIFFDKQAINDDVRNQIYWISRLGNNDLYPNDLIASYFTQSSLVSPIISNLYSMSSDPVKLGQFLPFLLVLISTFFLFKIAEKYKGDQYAFWVSFAFNVYIWTLKNLAGGLPRAFFYPLFFFVFS